MPTRIFKIGEHDVPVPEWEPGMELLYEDNQDEDCFWRRDDNYPEVWLKFLPNVTRLNQEASIKYDNSEKKDKSLIGYYSTLNTEDSATVIKTYEMVARRRTLGIHFRNYNPETQKVEIEYLTGDHWFTLQWCKFFGNKSNGGYGNFYKFQRDVFYLLDYMWQPWCVGLYISKAKKTGITQIIDGGYCVNKALTNREWLLGFMSRNEPTAIENNFKLFMYAYDNLPRVLQPKVGYRAPKGGNIEFATRAKASEDEDVLNTRVFCGPTDPHTFDSHFMNIIHLDEFPKYFQDSKQSPKAVLNGNKPAVKDQDDFRGRIIISSYPPEVDDIGSAEGASVYYNSKLSTIKYGRTETELICYHIPAYQSLKKHIDKYGNCDEKSCLEIIKNNLDRVKKDKKAWLAEQRQNPNNEKEAFGSNNSSTVFDPARMAELIDNLDESLRFKPSNPYVSGKLKWDVHMWEVGKQNRRPPGVFSKVIFTPLSKEELESGETARMKIFEEIPEQDRNAVLKLGRDELGNLNRPKRFKYVGGVDGTQYADINQIESGSRQASYTMNMYDHNLDTIFRRPASKIILSEYLYRPDLAEHAYQDVVKEIIYYGKLVVVEANAPHIATRLIAEGLGNYMIVKDKDGIICLWNIGMGTDYKLIKMSANAAQKELLETLIELAKMYLTLDEEGTIDYGATIKTLELLRQLAAFDVTDTKKFDGAMAWFYTLFALESYLNILLTPEYNTHQPEAVRAVLEAFSK